jgi:hypothetical protein
MGEFLRLDSCSDVAYSVLSFGVARLRKA